ncbi:MAG: hypothetical protein MZU95_02655 [Desulfomicrobium escambiense]|nr:hypothetical protein [Desulfomicrobium escambiense]
MHSGLEAVIEGLPYMLGGHRRHPHGRGRGAGHGLGARPAAGGRPRSTAGRGCGGWRGVYVWFFRGIPLLVLLFLIYFGILAALEIDLSPFTIAIVVLGPDQLGLPVPDPARRHPLGAGGADEGRPGASA